MATHRFWTLWEMLNKHSAIFSELLVGLHRLHVEMLAASDGLGLKNKTISAEDQKEVARLLALAVNATDILKSEAVTQKTQRIQESLRSGYKHSALRDDLADLQSRIEDELKGRLFLYVPSHKARYYDQKELFGAAVNDRFPQAIHDIEHAGNCLALGEGTATILHLMRVIEVGLMALAQSLGIPHARSWESYLTHIQKRINEKYEAKGIDWKRDEKIYRDISSDLITIKQAWRNPTMHVDRRYSIEEAEEIFRAVQSFMQRLAAQLPVVSHPPSE